MLQAIVELLNLQMAPAVHEETPDGKRDKRRGPGGGGGVFDSCGRLPARRPEECSLRFEPKPKTLSQAAQWTMPPDEGRPWEDFRWQQATLAAKHGLVARAAELVDEEQATLAPRGEAALPAPVVARQDFENWALPSDDNQIAFRAIPAYKGGQRGKTTWEDVSSDDAIIRGKRFDARDFNFACNPDEDQPWVQEKFAAQEAVLLGRASSGYPKLDKLRSVQGGAEQRESFSKSAQDRAAAPKMPCQICYAAVQEGMSSFQCERHFYCADCLATWLRSSLASGVVARCPTEGCNAEASPELCQRLLSEQEFDSYFILNLRVAKQLANCPVCSNALIVERSRRSEDGDRRASGLQIGRCGGCKHRFCMLCGLESHPMVSCEEARERNRNVAQTRAPSETFRHIAAALGCKQCPKCKELCEKADDKACDHMTCVACGFEFCWLCLADRDIVKAHGNHYHCIGCDHYRAYHGPLELERSCKRCQRRRRPCTPPGSARQSGRRVMSVQARHPGSG
eukprot:TRINITY_DN102278_c0_g1_i1.p1 TRINITY_DN102278_c0_g1~~TRINITY_DN102278_c0_g1_i1.p1  ORF type:complete len:511 (-),score=115.27 TRINITY_DN102278_c0_g1_i1:153-1685(-)